MKTSKQQFIIVRKNRDETYTLESGVILTKKEFDTFTTLVGDAQLVIIVNYSKIK